MEAKQRFTDDMGTTVVRPELIGKREPRFSSCTIQTVTGSPFNVLGYVDVRVRLVLVEFSYQMLV